MRSFVKAEMTQARHRYNMWRKAVKLHDDLVKLNELLERYGFFNEASTINWALICIETTMNHLDARNYKKPNQNP